MVNKPKNKHQTISCKYLRCSMGVPYCGIHVKQGVAIPCGVMINVQLCCGKYQQRKVK